MKHTKRWEPRRQAASGGKRSQASALQRGLAPSDDGGYGSKGEDDDEDEHEDDFLNLRTPEEG